MSSLAINIIIIPPKIIQKDIIILNKSLHEAKDGFELNTRNRIPHLTLLMGYIEESQIKNLIEKIINIKNSIHNNILIECDSIKSSTLPDNQKWQYIEIKPNESLTKLYNKIIIDLKPSLHYANLNSYLFHPEEINSVTLKWVGGHSEKIQVDTFYPHISIGIGLLSEDINYIKKFHGWKLGIYQLGNYCTCRKEIFSIKL